MYFQKSGIALGLIVSLFLIACGGKREKTGEKKSGSAGNPVAGITEVSRDTLALSLENGFVKGEIYKEERDKKYFVLKTDAPVQLSARLESKDTLANLRFTQIFFPDGSADGPFGRELEYDLEKPGTYVLSVGENMMAGEPWSGDFTIEVKVE
ncbi:hypothetical protein [Sinomicrobium sp. M5D2P17]